MGRHFGLINNAPRRHTHVTRTRQETPPPRPDPCAISISASRHFCRGSRALAAFNWAELTRILGLFPALRAIPQRMGLRASVVDLSSFQPTEPLGRARWRGRDAESA